MTDYNDTTPPTDNELSAADPEAAHNANPPVLRPEGFPVSQNPVVIAFGADTSKHQYVVCSFAERLDRFRDLVKPIGFRWNAPRWQIPVDGRVPDPCVFCAALAHQLLSARFMVQLKPYRAHQLALTETYDPLPTRWCSRVVGGEFQDWFRFTWPYSDEHSYSRCRTLPGSRYKEGAVYVPKGSAPAVLDFCESRGFALTVAARQLASEQQAALENSLILNVRPRTKGSSGKPAVPKDIDEELRDA